MRLSRRPTRWLSGWLIAMLLFTQLATAAYACPGLAAATSAQAAMPGCEGHQAASMDPEQPQLCHAHCQQGSQNVHPTPASDTPGAPLLLALLDWSEAALPQPQRPALAPAVRAGASPPGAPPLYLSLLVLRN
jgi:hypothetical protein